MENSCDANALSEENQNNLKGNENGVKNAINSDKTNPNQNASVNSKMLDQLPVAQKSNGAKTNETTSKTESDDEIDQWTDIESEEDQDNMEEIDYMKQAAFVRQMLRKRQLTDDLQLPKTVSLLEGSNGEKVYLVGTAHFSKESCEDVRKVISAVQPDTVVVELCNSRTQILTFDEEQLKEISNENRMDRLKKCINQKGLISGLVLYIMLQMSAHITKELGMAPGGEFRQALNEANKVPGCSLYLGDRPIEITMQRMLASLSLWQKLKFGFLMLQELKPISAEDVERMKEQDMFEQLMSEMIVEFPHMAKVLVTERDLYLTGSLQKAAKKPVVLPDNSLRPPVVVGVVGIGHTGGIKSHFAADISKQQMDDILRLPPPSRVKKYTKIAFRAIFLLSTVYGAYRLSRWLGFDTRASSWVSFS
ncbi:unnamed protein product [Clavelina lepadiformis]|uniref:TraB domain-containing protein n=1 Tax=Clavelina lepadiformis TaxID=159417 RepID=A0ABP0F7V6_CLALP